MKLRRRQFLQFTAATIAASLGPRLARAQSYPARPITLIVPWAPGGLADITSRLLAPQLSERLGQPLIIDNRPGAASNIGTETAARARADGYTLLFVSNTNAINATLYEKLNFDFIRDIAPVASVTRTASVLVVTPLLPVTTVPEFIDYARANPGRITMATQGSGSGGHIFGEMFKKMTGIYMVPVPYRSSGPALTDLMGGQVEVLFDTLPSSIEFIRAGKVRALAVTSRTRLDVLPDVPTVADFLPGYEAIGWAGIGAPRNTPTEVIDRLNREINAVLDDPKIAAQLADLGSDVLETSPAAFAKLIADDTEKWSKVIRAANIKIE